MGFAGLLLQFAFSADCSLLFPYVFGEFFSYEFMCFRTLPVEILLDLVLQCVLRISVCFVWDVTDTTHPVPH